MAKPGKRSWLARLEDELKAFYGPADVKDPGPPRARSQDRLEGSGGDYEMHRGPDGRTYLVARRTSRSAGDQPTGPAPEQPDSTQAHRPR